MRLRIGILVLLAGLFGSGTPVFAGQSESLEELYKKALSEEGVLNCYCSLAQINAEKIYPVFEKRFPGIKINHVDATSDKLSARAITEAEAGALSPMWLNSGSRISTRSMRKV